MLLTLLFLACSSPVKQIRAAEGVDAVHASLRALREDPEFQEIMAELKPRWEALVEWERGLG